MKKILSFLLASLLVMGTFITAAAAPSGTYALGQSGPTATHQGDIRPGEKQTYNIYLNGVRATRADIRSDKIDVRVKISEGSKAIDNVAIKYDGSGNAYVQVEYVDPFVSTKELDVTFTLYLTESKSKMDDTELTVIGTFANDEQFVDSGSDYVNMTHSPVVEAEDYIKLIEVDLGQGLSIFAKMFKDKRYYGYVTQDIAWGDDDVISRYPSISTIYNLQTINLNGSANYVKFDIGDKLYVYNADLEYLGTTHDKLPYSTRYYLSTAELDVEVAITPKDDDEMGSDEQNLNNSSTGGDTVTNKNANPNTGA